MRTRALIAIAVASAASAGGCTVGSGSGSAKGALWILGCLDGDPYGTSDAGVVRPKDFSLDPTFFAAEPIEDISDGPPMNRLIIYMKRTGNATEINDTITFDIRDSAQIARCIRGQTINGVPTWDTSSGTLNPIGQVEPTPPWCVQSTTPGELPQIRLVPFGPVAVSFTPFASCHSQMHPPAIVNVAGIATDGFITFSDFGTAVQSSPTKQADTAPDDRKPIPDDFKVNYGEHLQATFQFTVGDERYYAAIRDKIVPPPEQLIGGSLAGNFEFFFERGRSAQTFP